MAESKPEIGGLELWRGGVDAWNCDANGHLNIRFYLAFAHNGLAALAAALGMGAAFGARAASTLRVREQHVRFVREARANDPLHIVGGVIGMTACEAVILELVVHSATGEVAAAVTSRLAHVTAADGAPFPWSARIRERAQALKIAVPLRAAPRSLSLADGSAPALSGSLERAGALGLRRIGMGAVETNECDIFGRMRPDSVMGRISDGYPQFAAASRALWGQLGGKAGEPKDPSRIGATAVEMRLVYADDPAPGDGIELWSGLSRADEKTQTIVHWLLDPASGRPWAVAEHVIVVFDLSARKMITLPAEMAAALHAQAIVGLTI